VDSFCLSQNDHRRLECDYYTIGETEVTIAGAVRPGIA